MYLGSRSWFFLAAQLFLAAQQCLFLHYRTSLILGPSTRHHHLSEKSPQQDISKPSFNFKNHHEKLPSSRDFSDFPRFSPDFPHPPRAPPRTPWTFLGVPPWSARPASTPCSMAWPRLGRSCGARTPLRKPSSGGAGIGWDRMIQIMIYFMVYRDILWYILWYNIMVYLMLYIMV